MTDLRGAVAKLTHMVVAWYATELAELAEASVSRTRAYLANLANQGVVAPADEPDAWQAGPRARQWRLQPSPKGPTYGNSAEYRRQREILDKVKLRDWQARRAGAKEPTDAQAASQANLATLTSAEVAAGSMDEQELAEMSIPSGMTIESAAEVLGCTHWTVRRLIKGGKITAYRAGIRALRISDAEIADYLKRNQVKL